MREREMKECVRRSMSTHVRRHACNILPRQREAAAPICGKNDQNEREQQTKGEKEDEIVFAITEKKNEA